MAHVIMESWVDTAGDNQNAHDGHFGYRRQYLPTTPLSSSRALANLIFLYIANTAEW